MAYRYFDAHTHIHFAAYKEDVEKVIERARVRGVGMITAGTEQKSSALAVEFAHRYLDVWATVGLHPVHSIDVTHDPEDLAIGVFEDLSDPGEKFDPAFYAKLAADPRVVGIGECGLDYFSMKSMEPGAQETQRETFQKHLVLAHEVGKPLVIHCRNAYSDLIQILTEHKALLNPANAGIIHYFTGAPAEAELLLGLGFSFTFGGVVTFARSYDEAIKAIPADHILTETDAPYVSPVPHRGARNEPAYVVEVAQKLAEIRGVPEDEFVGQVLRNVERVFGIPTS